jgi:excisionase family DNA binding protein
VSASKKGGDILEYLTIRQAAEKLQVSTKTITRRIQDGSLPCYRLGFRTIRIRDVDLQNYINSKK